ncbi:hypothetical protein [Cellulomonas sp. Root137]|uniref:hypothetical protein n=1 Tax=Cellulomonas sp. Root137 TaxID=1736459 RepID=UPI0006FA69AA|nr:hypothetical protein [Cellulomonas sp. Root137]KQY47409.1 hypothetical protein ASD18_08745 [Cellulomonas sp. Root137]
MSAIVVVMALAGCSSPAEPAAVPVGAPTHDSTVVPVAVDGLLRWADGSPVASDPVDIATARLAVPGTDYEVVYTVPSGRVDDGHLVPMRLRADGRAVAAQVPTDSFDGGPWLTAPTTMGVLDGAAFTPFVAAQPVPGDHPRQAFDASVADGIAAWLESDSTGVGTPRWRVFAAGPDGRATLVARAEDIGAGGTSMAGSTAVWRGRVYWAAGEPGQRDVYSRAADGSGPLVAVATGVAQPTASSSGIDVVRSEVDDPAVAPGEASVERVVDGDQPRVLVRWSGVPGSAVVQLVADGEVVAFVATTPGQSGGQVHVVDTRARTARTVTLHGSGREASLALCDGRLQWSEADAQGPGTAVPTYVLDLVSGDLARIDVDRAFAGALCGGRYLAWNQLDAAAGSSASTVVARWNP